MITWAQIRKAASSAGPGNDNCWGAEDDTAGSQQGFKRCPLPILQREALTHIGPQRCAEVSGLSDLRVERIEGRDRHVRYHWAPWPRLSAPKGADMSRKLVIPLLAGCIGTQPSTAHDIYSHLADSEGASCCNQTDCAPAPFRVTPIGLQMLVHGRWIAVPSNKIQYRLLAGDTGDTGGGHWCGIDSGLGLQPEPVTRCAIVPPNSAAVVSAVVQ